MLGNIGHDRMKTKKKRKEEKNVVSPVFIITTTYKPDKKNKKYHVRKKHVYKNSNKKDHQICSSDRKQGN